jgi:SAM-dependent methyltransferase
MAFGYRNYDEEVEFLFDQHSILQQQARQPQKGEETDSSFFPRRVLELAAGPARHSLEAVVCLSESEPPSDGDDGGVSSTRVTAVDISKPMKQYGLELASTELDVDSQKLFDYRLGDMTNFDLFDQTDMISDKNQDTTATPFDTAWLLLGSLQHLTRNDDVVRCFQCVNKHLRPGGTFILELPHPRELFSLVECTRNGWEVPLEGEDGEVIGELKIVWGDDHDDFDPITQVRQFTVAMELTGASEEQQTNQQDEGGRNPSTLTTKVKKSREQSEIVVLQSVKEVVPMRHFTAQEIDCFAKLSGFELKSKFGALDAKVKIDDDDEAFRLVCILQKPYHTF